MTATKRIHPKAQFEQLAGDEIVSRRDAYSKVYDLGLGRKQAVIFTEPIHYKDNGGAWQEIDNRLDDVQDDSGRHILRNHANALQVEFADESEGQIAIQENGHRLTWRVHGGAAVQYMQAVKPKSRARRTPQEMRGDRSEMLRSQVEYANVCPGMTVRCTVSSNRVKQDFVLADASALKSAALLLPGEYTYTVDADMRVHVMEEGVEQFTFDAPYTYDAAGHETVASVSLEEIEDGTVMRYALDDAFLSAAIYPVTIDPVVNSTNAVQNIQDTTLGRGQTAKPYTADHLKIGKYGGSVDCVGLLQFNTLAIPEPGNTIIGAVLQMCTMSGSTSNVVAAYEILKPWESSAVNWSNFNPENTANISNKALECVKGKSSGWMSFDLTNLYRKWITHDSSGNSNNHGVAFRTPANMTGNNYTQLYSSDASTKSYRPIMYVNYISHAGLEGWWQYEQMSAGRAGTVYTDLFNGNMVLGHSDTVMSGNRMPVSVNHYYNSCLSGNNDYNCGYGWKTDAHQKITALTLNSRNYFVWTDGDGTQHHFEQTGSQPYKDSEGMDMEMTYTSGSPDYIIITDKEHNQMRFNVVKAKLAWLVAARDACHNTVSYSYVSGCEEEGRIDTITDPVGRVTKFNYSGNLLSNIRIPTAEGYRYVYYTYDGSNRLTGIRYSELGGTTAHTIYSYDGSTRLLTKVQNYDGVCVNIGYEALSLYGSESTDPARRILSMETVGVSNGITKRGAKQLFEYKTMCTEVTAVESDSSNEGRKLVYQFNDSGNVICVRDELGYARFTKFDSGLENKPSAESTLRRAVMNILRHPDLSADWTSSGTAAKDTTNTCLNVPSAKLTANGGESMYRQTVTLEGRKKYTLSAYLKCSGVTGNGAFVRLTKTNNASEKAQSTALTGTTDAALGNGMAADGWERVCVTIDRTAETSSATYSADLVLAATAGTAWFAAPQLEEGGVMNHVNLLSNGDFRYTATSGTYTVPTDWTAASNTLTTGNTGVHLRTDDSTFPSALSGNYLAIDGVPNKNYVGFQQNVNLSGKSGDLFTLGGWMDSQSVPFGVESPVDMRLALLLRFKKSDGTYSAYQTYKFNNEWVGWQFACFAASAPNDYVQIEFTISYVQNCNVSKFTNFFLYREAFGESFAYDSDKNLISASTLSGQKSDIKYDSAKNVNIYTQPGRDSSVADNQHWFYYGDSDTERKKHLLWRSRTPMHVTDYYTYDSFGNTTASRRVDYRVYTGSTADSAYPYIRTETAYSTDGNFTASTKDARGNAVTQNVDATDGTLTSVTDPNGQTVSYEYDDSKRVTGVQTTASGKTYKNAYTYANDRIQTVSHNTTTDETDVTYTFGYDALGRKTTVKVSSQTLSTNVYGADRSGLLSEVQYGNGGKVSYAYDAYDRLTGVKYDGEAADRYAYEYGANGQAVEVKDANLGRTVRTDYDLADRPCQMEVRNGDGVLYRARLKYDKLGNLEQFAENANGEAHKTEYEYDRDNRVTKLSYDGGNVVSYAYDALGRVSSRTTGSLTSTYGYVAGGYGVNSTTPLVASIQQNAIPFTYAYDSRGNIISETRNGQTTTYGYDALGQLIRVNDPHLNQTWVYNYDRGGNILSKVRYAYTTGTLGTALETIPYAYGDANWKDKLTAYNGNSITYDAIGNPLNDGVWAYEWQAGRQLKRMSAEGTTLTFQYDHNGLRTQKVVEQSWYPEITNYYLHGKLLTHMTVDYYDWDEVEHIDKLHFFYDAQSRPAKVSYNGVLYTYIHNLQGDVVGLLDNSGTLVVEYQYDAWGKTISTTGSLAETLGKRNPFRYRGYVYDEETGLYYLRSRYYNPAVGRFVNADEFIAARKDNLDHNLFAYCTNAPVKASDEDGHWSKALKSLAYVVAAIIAKIVVPAIGAEVQLVVNRAKAKKAIRDSGKRQTDYLVNYPYGGAENAVVEGIVGKYEWLYKQVNHGAPMDYKAKNRKPWWALGCSKFYFRGRMISFEEYGNLNYGYVGKALGIYDWIIYAGGGFAAFTGGGDKSWNPGYFFDSEDDHNNIAWGIDIYKEAWGND